MLDLDGMKVNNFKHSYFCQSLIEMFELQSMPIAKQVLRVSKKQAMVELNSLIQSSIGSHLITLYEERQTTGPSLKEIEEAISQDFGILNQLIQEAQERFEVRLYRLESMMVNIVTEELQDMRKQIKTLSEELSYKIALNDENEEITYLRNQLDYFKFEALKLFQENKEIRIQVKLLKKTLSQYQISLDAQHEALKKSKKREFKQKLRVKTDELESSPLKEFLSGDKNKTFKIAKAKNGKTEDTELRMKTQVESTHQIPSRNIARPISKSFNQKNIYSNTFYPRSKHTELVENRHEPINKQIIPQSFTPKKARNSIIIKNLNQILHPGPQSSQMLQNRVRKMRMRQQQIQRKTATHLKAHNRTYTEDGKQKGFFQLEQKNVENSKMFNFNDKNLQNRNEQLCSLQLSRKQSINNKNKSQNVQQTFLFRSKS